jgi:hypothetical protein
VERFRREGRLASRIAHPRCVFVLAADEDEGRPYIVMELMPGATLADLLEERGWLPPGEAIAKILDVIEGLQEAHRLGVIHRDVKPSNCFLEADGRVKVGDFGLAKALVGDVRLTGTGLFLGTPLFASPEQVRGEALDPQSDVYSLAATLYCLLTGKAPFEGGDAAVTLARIAADPAPSMRTLRPELPPQLDRVVRRGLERDRQRRWRNLDEFKGALVPFLPGRQTAGGPGVRFGAFLIDLLILMALGMLWWGAFTLATGRDLVQTRPKADLRYTLWQNLVGVAIWVLYFGVPEGLWGCTVGKRLLCLRVCTVTGSDPPGLGRALLRLGVYYVLYNLGGLILLPPFLFLGRLDAPSREQQMLALLLLLAFFPLEILGIGLLLSTMRRRNGWRCLHEFLSGTRVIQVPKVERRRARSTHPLDQDMARPRDLPDRVGPYAVRGALRWADDARVLLGEDRGLSRPVLLWLRPAAEPPLPPARRACSRPTRLRWLAGGREDWQWDAFLAPSGRPLADLVAAEGQLPWPEVRPLLEQLTEELATAAEEGTLPGTLAPGQVWVQPGGGVQLLDMPLRPGEADGAGSGSPPAQPALGLLTQVAVLALEGRPRRADESASATESIRAPVPEHAARLLDRLLGEGKPYRGVREWRADLQATRDRPAEVTRGRRAAHVAVLTAFLSVGLCCCMMPGGWLTGFPPLVGLSVERQVNRRVLQELEAAAARDFAAGVLHPQPLARPAAVYRLRADLKLRDRLRERLERDEREFQARLEGANGLTRIYVHFWEQVVEQQEAQQQQSQVGRPNPAGPGVDVRAEARRRAKADVPVRPMGLFMGAVALVELTFWPVVWVVWAFLLRGGLSYHMLGLSLVRSDGRRAGRLRCAWRALLVWGPPAALLVAAVSLDTWYWWSAEANHPLLRARWLSELFRWASLGLLLAYPVLAVCRPRRSLHDRLAGTYLVPR